jgi:GNAT superfamily N-acetyltransferase
MALRPTASASEASAIIDLIDRPAFAATVAGWVHNEWASLSRRTPNETLLRFTGTLRDTLPVNLVAVGGDSPVGVASLRIYDDVVPVRDVSPWVTNVYVPMPLRGQGIATALMSALRVRAHALGFCSIWLATEDQQALYARCGFRHDRQVMVGGQPADVMRSDLP